MSVNYQVDPYILYKESICSNQLKHQELLVATLKQLAEENKRLLKEREQFEDEKCKKKSEINKIKKNFINLLTVAQYEWSNNKCAKNDYLNDKSVSEILTKKCQINLQNMKNWNLFQDFKIEFLQQLIKRNDKNMEHLLNYDNAFDCRPYKGPKTPPTPRSKYRYNNSLVNKTNPNNQTSKIKPNFTWSLKDMLYYLNKYKDIFEVYSKSIDQIRYSNNCNKEYNMNFPNIYELNTIDKSRHTGDKIISNDTEFYQDLIEKHKKSLEMIENVGNQINPNLPFSNIPSVVFNSMSKDYFVNNSISELFNINTIYNDFTSQLIVKNPYMIPEQKYSSTESLTKDILVTKTLSNCSPIKTTAEHRNSTLAEDNHELLKEDIQKRDFTDNMLPLTVGDSLSTNSDRENMDTQNNFEDGEIVDSGDETTEKKINKIEILSYENKENEKSNKKSYKKMLKSILPVKLKKSISDSSKQKYQMSSLCSKYHGSWKSGNKTCNVVINKRKDLKQSDSHSLYYSTGNRKSRYHNSSPRKELLNQKHSNRYFRNSKKYTQQY